MYIHSGECVDFLGSQSWIILILPFLVFFSETLTTTQGPQREETLRYTGTQMHTPTHSHTRKHTHTHTLMQ